MNEEIVKFEEVTKKFGSIIALRDLSFTIDKPEIIGYLGPNGAGKTTTIRIILGLLRPTKGSAYLFGRNVQDLREEDKKRVGVVLETDGLYPYLSGEKNLIFYGQVYGLSKWKARERARELLDLVGLSERAGDVVKGYSRGMKRRLAIARALIVPEPRLLVFDEPTTGLDPEQQHYVRNLIKQISRDVNVCVFFSSHNLYEVQEISTRVIIINQGRLILDKGIDALKHVQSEIKIVFTFFESESMKKAKSIVKTKDIEVSDEGAKTFAVKLEREEEVNEILEEFVKHRIRIREMKKEDVSLEKIYLDAVRGGLN